MTLVQKKTPGRYKYVTEEKAGGATLTPGRLADFVAHQIVRSIKLPQDSTVRVLDPAVGEGVLLLSLLTELRAAGYERIDVYGFETNIEYLRAAGMLLR